MSLPDLIVITILIFWTVLAVHHIIKSGKKGGCSSCCSTCSNSCNCKNKANK